MKSERWREKGEQGRGKVGIQSVGPAGWEIEMYREKGARKEDRARKRER